MKFFATPWSSRCSGGNLADMMEHLAKVIRNRQWLSLRFRVLTAQPQLSKWILVALPAVVFVALNVINPEYMNPMFTIDRAWFCWGYAPAWSSWAGSRKRRFFLPARAP